MSPDRNVPTILFDDEVDIIHDRFPVEIIGALTWLRIQQEVCRPIPRISMMQITRHWTVIMHGKYIWRNKSENRSEHHVLSLDFSNESFVKSKLSFALIVEEKHTVWYNNKDWEYKNEKK